MGKQPKMVTDKDLAKFRSHTRGVVMGVITVGFLVGNGFGVGLALFALMWYVRKRDREYQLLLLARADAILIEQKQLIDNHVGFLSEFKHKRTIADANYGMSGEPFLCRICQQSYPSTSHTDVKLCWNLQNVFPHDPHDPPPNPNPFEWYWFKINGYALPPSNWPKTKVWMPKSAGDADVVTAMQQEGAEYYRKHTNSLWDRGMGRPPRWYYAQ